MQKHWTGKEGVQVAEDLKEWNFKFKGWKEHRLYKCWFWN